MFQRIFSFLQEKNCHLFFEANHLKAVICKFSFMFSLKILILYYMLNCLPIFTVEKELMFVYM